MCGQLEIKTVSFSPKEGKLKKGQIVYIKAKVIEVGDCGQIAVTIPQPNNQALVVPSAESLFVSASTVGTITNFNERVFIEKVK